MADTGGFSAFSSILGMAKAFTTAISEGDADRTMMEAKQEAFEKNKAELARASKLSNANALDALTQGSIQAGRARDAATTTNATNALEATAGGVDAHSGTPAAIAGATDTMAELQGLVAKNNAQREAFGHREVARKYDVQEQQAQTEMDAENEAAQGREVGRFITLGTSILTSII